MHGISGVLVCLTVARLVVEVSSLIFEVAVQVDNTAFILHCSSGLSFSIPGKSQVIFTALCF